MQEESVKFTDFPHICRICLHRSTNLLSIFKTDTVRMFKECKFLIISNNDNYPPHICMDCEDELEISYKFKLRCKKSLSILQKALQTEKEQDPLNVQENILSDSDDGEQHDTETIYLQMYHSPNDSSHSNLDASELNKDISSTSPGISHATVRSESSKNVSAKCSTKSESKTSTLEARHNTKRKKDLPEKNHAVKPSSPEKLSPDTKKRKLKDKGRKLKEEFPRKENTEICDSVKSNEHSEGDTSKNAGKTDNADFVDFLDKPLPSQLPHPCKECSESFQDKMDLEIHKSVHVGNGSKCLKCSKTFTNRQMLKRHLRTHMNNKPHVCPECNRSFAESYNLVRHMLRHNGITPEKKHVCPDCGQGFIVPYYLNLHRRKHTGERPLECTHCYKTFYDPRTFRSHLAMHGEGKIFECEICCRSFLRKSVLLKHQNAHKRDEQSYICGKCESSTTEGENAGVCEICDKRFSKKSNLDKHIRSFHAQDMPKEASAH